eukprot:CAMPEP_0175149562 /NCGR_PEP_ID=MMETSP0087-20121206/17318_1 /TAXON_ID=136419 /ORGANISM="Unknown Unknown, Strain D1" /LENGTH=175 /DNA_ID=CAMNT_0016435279 /DNA_START=46 /DNA_END=570 /DNA_ORIENTATION=+
MCWMCCCQPQPAQLVAAGGFASCSYGAKLRCKSVSPSFCCERVHRAAAAAAADEEEEDEEEEEEEEATGPDLASRGARRTCVLPSSGSSSSSSSVPSTSTGTAALLLSDVLCTSPGVASLLIELWLLKIDPVLSVAAWLKNALTGEIELTLLTPLIREMGDSGGPGAAAAAAAAA